MAAVLEGTFYDEQNQAYTVSIEDDSYGGAAEAMTLRDIKITYKGEEEIHSPIISSSCRAILSVPDSTVKTVLTNIASAGEEDYYMKILKGSALYWTGLVVMDLAVVSYNTYPFDFTLTATDGLARLKDIEYDDLTAKPTFHDILVEVLDHIPYNSVWGATDVMFKMQCQWWDTSQTGAYTYNPWSYARFSNRIFKKTEDNGEVSFMSCYDVLHEICLNWFCRIIQSEGVFWIWQVPRYKHTGLLQIKQYSKDGTLQSNSLLNNYNGGWISDLGTSAERLSLSKDATMRAGAIEKYLPPLKAVRIRYDHKSTVSLFPGVSWDGTGDLTHTNGPIDDNGGDATLLFEWGITVDVAFDAGSPAYSGRVLFDATIYIEESDATKHYLKRDATMSGTSPIYSTPIWTTTASVFQVYSSVYNISQSAPVFSEVVFITPPLPADGDVSILFEWNEFHSTNGQVQTPDNEAFDVAVINAELLYDGNPNHRVNYRLATATNTTANNSKVLEFTTLLGDGPSLFAPGAIEVENPVATGTWVKSTEWKYLDQVTYYDRTQLLAREILSMQNKPVYQLDGIMITDGDFEAHRLIEDGGSRMIMLSGSFDIIQSSWDLLLVEIDYDDTNVTAPAPTDSFTPPGGVVPVRGWWATGIDPIQGGGGGDSLTATIAQRLGLESTTSDYEDGDTIDSFNLEADTGVNLYVGDGVTVYNVATGEYQDLEVAFNSEDNDAINVTDVTATADFRPGSLITLSYVSLLQILAEARYKYVTIMLYDSTETVSGTVTEFPEFWRVPSYMDGYFLASWTLSHYAAGVRVILANDYHFRMTHDDGTTTKDMDIEVDFNKKSVKYDFFTDSDPYVTLATDDLITFSITAWDNTSGTPPDGLTVTLKMIATI